jgi:hypothetical protein
MYIHAKQSPAHHEHTVLQILARGLFLLALDTRYCLRSIASTW